VARIVEYCPNGSTLNGVPHVHHQELAADLSRKPQIMGDKDQRQPELLLEAAKQLEDLRLERDIKIGRRLVGDDERRAAGQRQGDRDTLPQSAGSSAG
jgi:hypothetical protein